MIEKLKNWFMFRKARKRAILFGQMIDSIDRAFKKKGLSRKSRRKFWYDFVNNPEARKRFIRDIGK